jgi:hypothetical protein
LEPDSIEIAPALTRWFASKNVARESGGAAEERVVLLKWLARIPQQFDEYFDKLRRLGYGKTRPPDDATEEMEQGVRDLMRFYRRIADKLPSAFAQTRPGHASERALTRYFRRSSARPKSASRRCVFFARE